MTKNDSDPLVTKPISLTQSTWDQLEQSAKVQGIPRAKYIRGLIEKTLGTEPTGSLMAYSKAPGSEENDIDFGRLPGEEVPNTAPLVEAAEKTMSDLSQEPEIDQWTPKPHYLQDCVDAVRAALSDRSIKPREVVPAELIAPSSTRQIVSKKDAGDVESFFKTPKESKKRF